MAQTADLTALYKNILASLGYRTEGYTVINVEDDPANPKNKPVMIDGKKLVIPVDEVLRNPKWKEEIAFHPLCEAINLGESQVLKALQLMVKNRLAGTLGMLMMELIGIANDKVRQAGLPPTLLPLLAKLQDVDDKAVATLQTVFSKLNRENPLVHINFRRKAVLGTTTYRRAAIFSSAFIDQIHDESLKKVLDTDVRKKDKLLFRELVEWILPGVTTGVYSCGSNSDTAPYLDALMQCYYTVQKHINAAAEKLKSQLVLFDEIYSDLSWMDEFADLSIYTGLIGPLAGNDGERPSENKGAEIVTQRAQPVETPRREPERQRGDIVEETLSRGDLSRDVRRQRELHREQGQRGPVDELDDWHNTLKRGSRDRDDPPFAPRGRRREEEEEPKPLFAPGWSQEDSRGRERDRYRDDRDDRGRGRDRDYDDRRGGRGRDPGFI